MVASVTVDTAGGGRSMTKGARMKVAWWDGPNDFLLLRDSPCLMTVGERVQYGPLTFLWVNKRK